MKTAKPVEVDRKPHKNPGKKQKPKNSKVVPFSEAEVGNMQMQKSGNAIAKHGVINRDNNRFGLNGVIAAVHGSRSIYDQGSEVMFERFQESLKKTGDINHSDTQKMEKGYAATLNVSQIQEYYNLKSGNYFPKTLHEQALAHQEIKNPQKSLKTTEKQEIVKKVNNKPEESKQIINQKPKEKPVEIKNIQIKPAVSDVNTIDSKKIADKNDVAPPQKNKGKDEKRADHKKSNTKTKAEKETKVVIPDDIQAVVTPRMDKAVDSEQVEIAPDEQTTINIVGLVAAAQEFRDQGVEARAQVKTQNEAAKTIKNKIKEAEKEIQKSDADLEKSEDSIQSKENLVHQLEKGLETSVKRQQKVEQEVGTYQEEYRKNKSKASDLSKESNDLLGGSQKHQDPENADSGKLTQKLRELNTNAGTIDQAVSQSGTTVQKLIQEAQQAKAKNTTMRKEVLSSRESLRKSKAKLASDTKKNKQAKDELKKLTPKLKQVESQSEKLNQEANGLLLDSYIIESDVIKTQNAYYKNMATVEGRNSLQQKEKDKIQQAPKDLDFSERLLMDFTQLKSQDERVAFLRKLNPSEQNLLKDKFDEVNANYDNDQSDQQSLINENVESIRNAQIEKFNNKRKDALQKPLNLVTKNLNRITGLKRLWMSITIAFSGIWNDITSISWTDVGKFIESIFSPKAWYETISGSISGIWDDLTNWKGFSQDPVGMILQKAAGIANKVLAIAGVITGILGVLALAAAVGSIFTLGGLAPLAAWLGGATITMGTITFWIGAIALGLNVLNGIKNIYDIHTAKTAEVLFKNSGELKSDIANSGMAIMAMIGGKASKKGGASIKDLAKRNPKTFGKRTFINVKNGLKAKIVSIPRKITSVFKKETWIKAAQSFKAAYKKAQEWVTEPFRKKSTVPQKRNLNQLPFEEQTVPDRMHEQPLQERSKIKSNIKEGDVKPIQTEHGKSYGQAKTHEGHTVTMTEKGEIYICASPCEPIREKYTLELEQNPELSRQIDKLEADITLTDQEKADWIAEEIEPKLSKIKAESKKRLHPKYTDGFYNGKKPKYENPGHHDPKSGKFRGGGSKTEIIPDNHEELWKKAIPGFSDLETKQGIGMPKTWYSIDDTGKIHQFQVDNNGIAHWAGSEKGVRGIKVDNVTAKRLKQYYKDFKK
jgi:hypothetical protein